MNSKTCRISFEEKGLAVHGFNFSEYDGKLDLYITSYKRANDEYTIYRSDAEATQRDYIILQINILKQKKITLKLKMMLMTW